MTDPQKTATKHIAPKEKLFPRTCILEIVPWKNCSGNELSSTFFLQK